MTSKAGDEDVGEGLNDGRHVERDGQALVHSPKRVPGEEGNQRRQGETNRKEESSEHVISEVPSPDRESWDHFATNGQLYEEHSLPPEAASDTGASEADTISGPDDTPSAQGSLRSSPSGSLPGSRASFRSSPASFPFDRRFHARVSSSSSVPRVVSPAFLTARSRQSSVSSQLTLKSQDTTTEAPDRTQNPWEVVRWSRLKKISSQAFSEAGTRAFGRPSFLTIGASIAIGTSKGIILLFDYQQTLKSIIGQGTLAAECGSVTSIAISADHSTVASGHANGSIFTWDLSRPAKPFLYIPAISKSQLSNRKSDGHVSDCAVLHVGFLGQRHTALVSADDSGMAFSHLASRGLGAVGRTVKTTRILGRYQDTATSATRFHKPSSVLAFASLPLGNVEQATDDLGLTALLTPYLLVIVSTTPVAQTQFKRPREKGVDPHGAISGCLAWFPAVKLKNARAQKGAASKTKLVYCWSNVLHLLDIEEEKPVELTDSEKRPELSFRSYGHWVCEEAIAAVQWLSRSILTVLTITQRLIILEDITLRVAESSDLNSKHIYHRDLFSAQLQPLVDTVEPGNDSIHGVVPDAYHMSFKAYKGRLFLLGERDVSMGTLSNWADRLMTLMEAGSPIAAIDLATKYYNGEADMLIVGLPDDDTTRHALVKDKLLDVLTASLRYIFNDETNRDTESDLRTILAEFARVAFGACISVGETSFLFDEVYDWYCDSSMQDVFLYQLESSILELKIDLVPRTILDDILNWYSSHDLGSRLEEILCCLKTETMDIDRVSAMCRQLRLYDALIYVQNQARDDFVAPLVELMSIIGHLEDDNHSDRAELDNAHEAAQKIFPYLAYALTGRKYPTGSELSEKTSIRAKASLFGFIFAGKSIKWPETHDKLIRFRPNDHDELTYPYLRRILHFNVFNFMSMLNEVFEDSFLNPVEEHTLNDSIVEDAPEYASSMSINRQRIVNILLEVVAPPEFDPEDRIFLDIFLARNVSKFGNLILLSGKTLRQILVELCSYPRDDLFEECQLSVEYLLSTFSPTDVQDLIPVFIRAGFVRVLRSTYRRSKQYAKWLKTFFEFTQDQQGVFECIEDCLRPSHGLSRRQILEVKGVIKDHAHDLGEIDAPRMAVTLLNHAVDLLNETFNSLDHASRAQFLFLRATLDSRRRGRWEDDEEYKKFVETHREDYIKLLCRYDPQQVSSYVSSLSSGDLRLDRILPALESSGAIDAAVILLVHDGLSRAAMDRLTNHLGKLQVALTGLMNAEEHPSGDSNVQTSVDDVLDMAGKYVKLGIWLCQTQSLSTPEPSSPNGQRNRRRTEPTEGRLTAAETLWLDLLDSIVAASRAVTIEVESYNSKALNQQVVGSPFTRADDAVRSLVQSTFTSLLASTSSGVSAQRAWNISTATSAPQDVARTSHAGRPSSQSSSIRFLPIFEAFLSQTSKHTTSIASLRAILASIFSAYAFESSMLSLANAFLDKDAFAHIEDVNRRRQMGWRPRGQLCEGCRRRCWGVGAGGSVWEAWRSKMEEEQRKARTKAGKAAAEPSEQERFTGKGKEKAIATPIAANELRSGGVEHDEDEPPTEQDALVVFSCMHLWHRRCLERVLKDLRAESDAVTDGSDLRCPLCT